MSKQISVSGNTETKSHHWLSPIFHTLTPRHGKIYGRYQVVRIIIDFSAAFCFVAGSVLFLYPNAGRVEGRLFLAGSLLFAVKPTIDLVRAFHLRKLIQE
jgi:hypothetical protein